MGANTAISFPFQYTVRDFYKSTVARHLLFLILALLTITLAGYHFGTFDQAIHIPFLKKYADPSLFPNDKFFDLRFLHYSYFWFFFEPFYWLGLLEEAMFLTHVFATYLTFWALWTLSYDLFQSPAASLLSLIVFVFPHLGFAAFSIFEFSLLNRTFVFPFLIFSLVLFLRQRYWLAFALLGVMYNLHVISVNFVLAMLLLDCLIEFRRVGWLNLLLGIVSFILTALPVLVWKFSGSGVDLTPRPEWFSIITRGVLYNIFYLFAGYPQVVLATLSGMGGLGLLFIARRFAPLPRTDRTIMIFIYAALLILGIQVIATHWLPVTIIIQSQITRAGLFILLFSYLYFTHYLVHWYESGGLSKFNFGLLMSICAISPFSFVPLIIWGIQRLTPWTRWQPAAAASIALVSLSTGSAAVAPGYEFWYPGIYISGHRTAWYDVQIWARNNTSKDTVFITPPQIWWWYESDWRVFSERSTVATLSELLEAAFAPEYIDQWQPRFEALAPGALEQFKGNYFENVKLTAQAFYGLSSGDLACIAGQYKASYLVVEKPHWRNFPEVYENEQYVVYDLRDKTRVCSAYSSGSAPSFPDK
jgi:hypothetical protein